MPIDPVWWLRYGRHKTAKQLAKKFACEENSVYTYARKHDMPYRSLPRGSQKKVVTLPTKKWHKECLSLYREHYTPAEIAKLLGRPYHGVYRVITRYRKYLASLTQVEEVV